MNNVNEFEESLMGRPNTIRTQTSLFRHWVVPYLDDYPIDKNFLPLVLRKWWDEDISPGTMKGALVVAAKYVEFITGNKPNTRKLMSIINSRVLPQKVKCWTKDEAVHALDVCKEKYPEYFLPLLLTLHTGMRKGELCGLKWSDVDWIKGRIKVQRSYDGPTKNGKGRTIPISKRVADLLERCYIIGEEEKPVIDRIDLNYHLKKLCRLAGVRVISFHGLRHSYSTLALEAGVSPRQVQAVLGHSSLTTTLNLYWDKFDEDIDLDFLP